MTHIPQPGTIVDRGYLLQEQLGEGGMGAVYRAVHLITGEPVALKLISKRLLLDTQEFLEESAGLHERLAQRSLRSHPGIDTMVRTANFGTLFPDEIGELTLPWVARGPRRSTT